MEIIVLVIILIVLTFASGYFSASETALFSIPSTKLRSYQHTSDPRSHLIARLLSRPGDLLLTILILNVCVNILIQNIAANLFANTIGWFFKVGVPLVLTLVFGEIVPKSIAMPNNVTVARQVAPVINSAQHMLGPVRKCLSAIIAYVSRFLFFFLHREKQIAKDEFIHILNTSTQKGVLSPLEASFIGGYLNLQDVTVKELMRPRGEILFYDLVDPLDNLINLFTKKECSRIPICEGELEHVLGIMQADQFFLYRDIITTPEDLLPYIKKMFFIPETMSAKLLLQQMTARNEQLALVVDEYGAITGLITLEDLMEEVVGEIDDLRDIKKTYTEASKNVLIASGKMEISDFEEFFNIILNNPYNMVTIGGWLTSMLGDIPKSGTKHTIGHCLFHVLAADQTRIRRLYIRKLNKKK